MTDRLVHSCELEGRPVSVFERSGMVPNPALQMIPTPMVVEVFYECPAPDWPEARIRARRGVFRLLARLGHRPGVRLDEPEFNLGFRVDAADEDFAIALLSPEMQRFMLEKRGVDWSVGNGRLRLYYRGRLRRGRMARSLDRFGRFWTYVPPELANWKE